MYGIVWEFRVRAGAERAFIDGYDANGAWVRLFRRSQGFRGTELTRSVRDLRVFYTLDTWESEDCYQEFRRTCQQEYEALDKSFEGLTEQERLVGILSAPAASH